MDDVTAVVETLTDGMLAGMPYEPGFDRLRLEQAFEVQNRIAERLIAARGPLAGWKVAWNAPALMQKFGMPHPGMGRVFRADMVESGGEVSLAGYQNLMLEAEIVARLAQPLGGAGLVAVDDVRGAIDGFTVGFEVLDRRRSPAEATAPGILMQNVFNAGAVLGDVWTPPEALDPGAIHTVMRHGDHTIVDGTGLAPQCPFEAVAFLANHYGRFGIPLEAGHIILCGSHIPLYPVTEPGEVTLSMGALGAVSLRIVP